jgi:hypothetical protein
LNRRRWPGGANDDWVYMKRHEVRLVPLAAGLAEWAWSMPRAANPSAPVACFHISILVVSGLLLFEFFVFDGGGRRFSRAA